VEKTGYVAEHFRGYGGEYASYQGNGEARAARAPQRMEPPAREPYREAEYKDAWPTHQRLPAPNATSPPAASGRTEPQKPMIVSYCQY